MTTELRTLDNLPELPDQTGWVLVMHGYAVTFANNAEKAIGRSPGCETKVYTSDQMCAYALAAVEKATAELRRELRQQVNEAEIAALTRWFEMLRRGDEFLVAEEMSRLLSSHAIASTGGTNV